ncbi:HET-domain-containing protein [Apiospora rasikravindrae]|uniref:HET-domain-containing protein n=1 Tax=Apiospora rasikravindrae TaxID=990691 RepID=A0ABR1RPH3_9PEZI
MRLIAVRSFTIGYFAGEETPPYAILSHTWGPNEVTLQDMQAEFGGGDDDHDQPNAPPKSRASRKEGFQKIKYTCKQAARDGLEWAWVDTCCIDKTSSAELSEAINSMYRWYNEARRCYAYLEDVMLDERAMRESDLLATATESSTDQETAIYQAIRQSRWITRGWTLQELLAPNEIEFFNARWSRIGYRNRSLRSSLARATGIDQECLQTGYHARLANYSIATRMSWASRRSCTRTEDIAYCLMGIFDINMPMLYGEGKKAFVRLQEEILKETEDHSLFAWAVAEDSGRAWCPSSVFAESPADFAQCGNIKRPESSRWGLSAMTKLGLSIELGEPVQSSTEKNPHYLCDEPYKLFYFTLDCLIDGPSGRDAYRVKIALLSLSTGVVHDLSVPSFYRLAIPRIEVDQCSSARSDPEPRRVYIRKNLSPQELDMFHHGTICFQGLHQWGLTMDSREKRGLGFLTYRKLDERGGIVKILMDPSEYVGWSTTRFSDPSSINDFTVAIGVGPNTLYCYVDKIDLPLTLAGVKYFDQPRSPTTSCVDYWNKNGPLVFDEFTWGERTYRVEVFHDHPSTAHNSHGRLHLLVIFSLIKVMPTPRSSPTLQQTPSSAKRKRRSIHKRLLGFK